MLLTLNFVHLIIKNKDKTKYLVYLVAIAFKVHFSFYLAPSDFALFSKTISPQAVFIVFPFPRWKESKK